MNEDFEISANSKLYKILYFFSNFFLTGWIVPRFGDDPRSRLICFESVCNLFTTIIQLILFLILCTVVTIYGLKNIFIIDPKDLVNPNVFDYMGFIYKWVFISLITMVTIAISCAYISDMGGTIFNKVVSKLPDTKSLKLISTYFKDKTKGICRHITITDIPEKK